MSRKSARASVDFPEPDSPTSPSVSPAPNSKLTSSSAANAPNCTRRLRTSSSAFLMGTAGSDRPLARTARHCSAAAAAPRSAASRADSAARMRSRVREPPGSAAVPADRACARGAQPANSARTSAADPCRDGARAATDSSAGAFSTTLPAYITTIRSASPATRPRSWLISTMAIPSSARRLRSKSMICACTVTSSAVVGSSAISRSGSPSRLMPIITR